MLQLATPPNTPVVTLDEAKAHLRVFHDDDDDYIQALVDAAVGQLDGADGWLNRALGSQSWVFSLERFPWYYGQYGYHDGQRAAYGRPQRIYIPLAPLISVDAVEYVASDETTKQLTNFRVFGAGSTQPGYIMPALDTSWPSTICDTETVRITFTAGYANAAAIPSGIKHAIKLMVGHWFENREAVTINLKGLAELPMGVVALLMPLRNWRG